MDPVHDNSTERLPIEARSGEGLQLFLLGFVTLFLELVLIRYLAANVWNLGFFPNLVLVAVFVGMGAGFTLHPRVPAARSAKLFALVPWVLCGLALFVWIARPRLPGFEVGEGQIGGELFFTGAFAGRQTLAWIPLCFATVSLVFALVSQRTAKLFRRFAPLTAYTLDILGSCAGILAFMLASFLQLPAWSWFVGVCALLLVSMPRALGRRRRSWLALPAAGLVVIAWQQDRSPLAGPEAGARPQVVWSPYQKVEYVEGGGVPQRREIFVNGIGHQRILSKAEILSSSYEYPYTDRRRRGLPPCRNVLVIGAGSGNDVAAALLQGAEHVDAVEIDPAIAALGERFHPLAPYADPRVRLVIDDGRAFLTRADRRYDLIVFALTDSLVKVSAMAQLRLENYLFTREAMSQAFALLSERGDLVLYNNYRQRWLVDKITRMLALATGRTPEVLLDKYSFAIIGVNRAAPPGVAAGNADVGVPSDDWPFLYLRRRGIPAVYGLAMLVMFSLILTSMLLLQRSTERRREASAPLAVKVAFLLMGVAFLLLETKSVVQFSLLFGTTWLNNSLVFLAVLLLVLAANWTAVVLGEAVPLWGVYLLLVSSSLATLVVPLGTLLTLESDLARFALASLLTFSPIFFANLLFSITFRRQPVAEQLFGWNLIGATLGGVLEYTSMAFGYGALAVVVAICYTAAFAALLVGRRSAATGARAMA